MINGLMGYKLGMTQVFMEGGRLVPVTVVQVLPHRVVQIKKGEKEGYDAAQMGFDERPVHRVTQPIAGHFEKGSVTPMRHLREFQGDLTDLHVGDVVTVDIFKKGDIVNITGISRGKGFQGVMKRHHFAGGPATHGSMFHRAPGSIGQSSFPSRVFKNKKLPGHMGDKRVTVLGLSVADVMPDQHILCVRGSVPGSPKGLVLIHRTS